MTGREPVGDGADRVVQAAANWRAEGWDAGAHFLASLSVARVEELIRLGNDPSLREYGLTHARHEALAVLYFSKNGELPLARLGERLLLHPTSVTSTVDALARAGLVERVPHPTDGRTTLARVTDRGREAMERTCRSMAERCFGLGALSEDEAVTLFAILRKVRAGAGDLGGVG